MITSLLAQGYNSTDAARVATFLHGLSAEITSQYIHPRSFIASDIIDNIGKCYINLDSIF
jgi:NAD(P)H-hydrate repair Nnr-like enzyme with NAD(P)H-hydrate dehydratase domain